MFVTAGAFAILAAHGRAFFWHRLKKWEAWIPAALLALAYLASFFGIDFYRSFWSLFVRGDGLLMLTCAVTSFYLIFFTPIRNFLNGSCAPSRWPRRLSRCTASASGLWAVDESAVCSGTRRSSPAMWESHFSRRSSPLRRSKKLETRCDSRRRVSSRRHHSYRDARHDARTRTRGRRGAYLFCVSSITSGAFGSIWARILLVMIIIFGGLFFTFRGELRNLHSLPSRASLQFHFPTRMSRAAFSFGKIWWEK